MTRVITTSAIFAGLFIPSEWMNLGLPIFAMTLIIAGIPHGAGDHLIFKKFISSKYKRQGSYFFGFYLIVLLLYGFTWWASPELAFSIFILVSIYHFGQSHWNHISFNTSFFRIVTYFFWGSLVTITPVLLYSTDSQSIIQSITGNTFNSVFSYKWQIIFILFFTNMLILVWLLEKRLVSTQKFHGEIFNLLLLEFLFFSTPLLLGFAIYFVFWHSTKATVDQFEMLKSTDHNYQFRDYIFALTPLTIMAFIGLIGMYLIWPASITSSANWGVLFLFISLITLPHAFLVDRFLHRNAQPVKKFSFNPNK
ncbi:MAG: Brp/Blh family beta-carotene 15,15'-dioxygenase [Bacteroidota bacterium]